MFWITLHKTDDEKEIDINLELVRTKEEASIGSKLYYSFNPGDNIRVLESKKEIKEICKDKFRETIDRAKRYELNAVKEICKESEDDDECDDCDPKMKCKDCDEFSTCIQPCITEGESKKVWLARGRFKEEPLGEEN